MGLFLLFLGLTIVGGILVIISKILDNISLQSKYHVSCYVTDKLLNIGSIIFILFGIVTLIVAFIMTMIQINAGVSLTVSMDQEYLAITSQLKNGTDNQYLVQQISKYNGEIAKARAGLNNPWLSWFFSKKIAELPMIVLG